MSDDEEQDTPEGPEAFFAMLIGSAVESQKKLLEIRDKMSAPAVQVRLPVGIITRLIDNVSCECDMCLGTLQWAKSIDTSNIDDQLKRLIELAIHNAELRLLCNKQHSEYKRLYGHSPQ